MIQTEILTAAFPFLVPFLAPLSAALVGGGGGAALPFLFVVFIKFVFFAAGSVFVVGLGATGSTTLPPFFRTRSSGCIRGITPPEAMVTCFSICKGSEISLYNKQAIGRLENFNLKSQHKTFC